ncbi:MAG TPA: gliding motility-associated C-terminal domain-containing protein [Flavobacterium sp.]|nr:gliding motility-associated C-terminal domain-containing protein [Flavobacterium sp.]
MVKKICSWNAVLYFKFFILFACFFAIESSTAQCAGDDAVLTVCDIANPANQNINLFNLLGGSPTPGGVWSDPLQTTALDPVTGILNVWDIHISGVYQFIYTVAGACNDTAIVTVTVGGYSGIPSPNGSACNDDDHVNLFQFFVGIPPNPHLNGSWHDDDSSGALNGNIFNATNPPLGTYHFTYTMAAVGSCPAQSSTVTLTTYRVPNPGIPSKLILCNTVDFSQLTNFDLADLLAGEDPNGHWAESGTSELSGPFDSFVDVQNIYNTFGLGTYNFSYTVYPTNPVCDIKTSNIQIVIEEPLDFTGAVFTVNSDICEGQIGSATYTATLTQGTILNPVGAYVITYEVSGTTPLEHTIIRSFVNGIITIPLTASWFPQIGTYTVTITHIVWQGNYGACENIIDASDDLHIYPIPKINAATLTINPVCQNNNVVVELSGTNNLGTGTYEITYNLSGSNILTSQIITINSVAGIANFTIPASQVPNAGTTTIKITHIVNMETGCENTSTLTKAFVINPNSTLTVTAAISDACENQSVTVQLSGLGNLGSITVQYNLSGANTAANETIALIAVAGNASFVIPPTLIPNLGTTTFTIISINNVTTGCNVTINTINDDFTINAIPGAPTANNAAFCQADNATVDDLVPNDAQFYWYTSATGTNALPHSTLLTTGNYYVAEINGNNCSSVRTMISVVVTAIPEPTLNPEGQNFCGADNPTLQNLTNNTSASDIIWYDAPANGNPLPDSNLLQQGVTYYGFGASNTSGCLSDQALAVTVTLTDCDETTYDFFIPDGFSPNGDSVNDVFQIPEIQFLYPDYTLEIYNRYGNLMFKGNINSPAWDGKNSQSENTIDGIASNGIYFYVVNFNKDKRPPRQGFLYLNR